MEDQLSQRLNSVSRELANLLGKVSNKQIDVKSKEFKELYKRLATEQKALEKELKYQSIFSKQ